MDDLEVTNKFKLKMISKPLESTIETDDCEVAGYNAPLKFENYPKGRFPMSNKIKKDAVASDIQAPTVFEKDRERILDSFKIDDGPLEKMRSARKNRSERDIKILDHFQEQCNQLEETQRDSSSMEVGPKEPYTVSDQDDLNEVTKQLLNDTKNYEYKNMSKVEQQKLEWMNDVPEKKCKIALDTLAKSQDRVRFHPDGFVIIDDNKEGTSALVSMDASADFYSNSLRHHGEEPNREGYTITELFLLAQSSFVQQRNFGIKCLVTIIKKTRQLKHVHVLEDPICLPNLIKSGLVMLARFLLDDADLQINRLVHSIDLFHELLFSEFYDRQIETDLIFNWPDQHWRVLYYPINFKRIEENKNPNSADAPDDEGDDKLIQQDVISTLVYRMNFVRRFKWILLQGQVELSDFDWVKLIEIFELLSQHSLAVLTLICEQNNELFDFVLKHSLKVDNNFTLVLAGLRLVRSVLASESIAYSVFKSGIYLTRIYDLLLGQSDIAIKQESCRILSRLLYYNVCSSPISTILTSLIDLVTSLLSDKTELVVCQNVLQLFTDYLKSIKVIPNEIYAAITDFKDGLLGQIQIFIVHNNKQILACLLHFFLAYYQREIKFNTSIGIEQQYHSFYRNILKPILEYGMVLNSLKNWTDLSNLRFEHCHSNMRIVRVDLDNLKQPISKLAVMTRNPDFIDIQPYYIDYSPNLSFLTAIFQSLNFIGPNFNLTLTLNWFFDNVINRFDNLNLFYNESILYLISIQAELNLICNCLLWLKNKLKYETCQEKEKMIYKCTLSVLPWLGPRNFEISKLLFDNIIFNGYSLNKILPSKSPENILKILSLKSIYSDYFQWSLSLSNNFITNFPKHKWLELPICESVNLDIIYTCFDFIDSLGKAKLIPYNQQSAILSLNRILIRFNWLEFMECGSKWQNFIDSFLRHNLSDLSKLETPKPNEDYFIQLRDRLFFSGYDGELMSNLVLSYCAMKYPDKYRMRLWCDNQHYLRFIFVNLSRSLVQVCEYLEPAETNVAILQSQWRALCDGVITEGYHGLMYWIAVNHLNKLLYNLQVNDAMKNLQRELFHAVVCNLYRKPFFIHLKMFKHFREGKIDLYYQLPGSRIDVLDKICESFI